MVLQRQVARRFAGSRKDGVQNGRSHNANGGLAYAAPEVVGGCIKGTRSLKQPRVISVQGRQGESAFFCKISRLDFVLLISSSIAI
jgi:hypothetical protein